MLEQRFDVGNYFFHIVTNSRQIFTDSYFAMQQVKAEYLTLQLKTTKRGVTFISTLTFKYSVANCHFEMSKIDLTKVFKTNMKLPEIVNLQDFEES